MVVQRHGAGGHSLEQGMMPKAQGAGKRGEMHTGTRAPWVAALAGVALLAGCSVHVNKGEADEHKDVSIHTPFGGMEVHKDDAGAMDVGLPVYPGAVLAPSHDDGDKSADVQMGFGPWQLRVRVANYVSGDAVGKVQAFYRKALGRYGAVLTCRGEQTIGEPAATPKGLTCRDEHSGKASGMADDASLELKAGSERRQHIVAFETKGGPGTHFSLVALSLPAKGAGQVAGSEE